MSPTTSSAPSTTRRSDSSNGAGSGHDRRTGARTVAMAVGAAAVGALVLKGRGGRKKVLGLPLPRSSDLDVKSVAKTVGKASKEFGKTSKRISKDIERLGNQAEHIGKILS